MADDRKRTSNAKGGFKEKLLEMPGLAENQLVLFHGQGLERTASLILIEMLAQHSEPIAAQIWPT
jgi:electron transfer flavoprotein alpha subunit